MRASLGHGRIREIGAGSLEEEDSRQGRGKAREASEGLMSFQAAAQMGATKIVKVLLQEPPEFFLEQGHAKVAQMVVLEVFATNEVRRPFFTLGIVSPAAVTLAAVCRELLLSLAP